MPGFVDNAQVFGHAQVFGSAWVTGDAQVSGNAEVYDNAMISGRGKVFGRTFGRTRVFGYSVVTDDAEVSRTPWNTIGPDCSITITDNHVYLNGENFPFNALPLLEEPIRTFIWGIIEGRSKFPEEGRVSFWSRLGEL